MMATTHGFVGAAAAALVAPVVSEYVAPPLVVAVAFAGGLAPDLDLVADHRRTLHFPVGFSVAAAVCSAVALATASPAVMLVTAFVAAGALHAASDVLGGSAEHEPWNPTTDRGVYNHVLGRWHQPRRYVRYSGAPEDLLVALPFAAVAIAAGATGPTADTALLAALVASAGYVSIRRRLGVIAAYADPLVPAGLRRLVSGSERSQSRR